MRRRRRRPVADLRGTRDRRRRCAHARSRHGRCSRGRRSRPPRRRRRAPGGTGPPARVAQIDDRKAKDATERRSDLLPAGDGDDAQRHDAHRSGDRQPERGRPCPAPADRGAPRSGWRAPAGCRWPGAGAPPRCARWGPSARGRAAATAGAVGPDPGNSAGGCTAASITARSRTRSLHLASSLPSCGRSADRAASAASVVRARSGSIWA